MRLVDADELMEHVYRDKLDSRELIAEMIKNAPTIKEISTKIPIDMFEKLTSQESILDRVRADVEQERKMYLDMNDIDWLNGCDYVLSVIDKYKEPKIGHWIKVTNGRGGHKCDLCNEYAPSYQSGNEYLTNYCPYCGAKMVETQESEG